VGGDLVGTFLSVPYTLLNIISINKHLPVNAMLKKWIPSTAIQLCKIRQYSQNIFYHCRHIKGHIFCRLAAKYLEMTPKILLIIVLMEALLGNHRKIDLF